MQLVKEDGNTEEIPDDSADNAEEANTNNAEAPVENATEAHVDAPVENSENTEN